MLHVDTTLRALRSRRSLFAAGLLCALAALFCYEPPIEASHFQSDTQLEKVHYADLPLAPQPAPLHLTESDADTGVVCDPALPLPLGANALEYTSGIIQAPRWFNAVGFTWSGDLPPGARVLIDVRSSEDGVAFTPWSRAEELDGLRGEEPRSTDLVFGTGRFLQYRVAVEDAPDGWTGKLDAVDVTYIDSTNGPSARVAEAASGSLGRQLFSLMPPPVITRAAWGANERLRIDPKTNTMIWPPSYSPVKKIILHHTATPSNPQDPAAVVRAIYEYHTVSQGWGDIGYNFLIDQDGRVYEGRYGGRNVIGAHALQYNKGSVGIALIGTFDKDTPTGATGSSVDRLVVAKAVEYGIDPKGTGFFIDKVLPNIMGHRDAVNTSCPGAIEYAQLPNLRDRVLMNMPTYGQSWTEVKAPSLMEPGGVTQVDVTVRNSGSAPWTVGLKDPVRVGYHWVTPDGKPYLAEDLLQLEIHTDLPRTVNPGDGITLKATVRAPTAIGKYVLQWDMVQERVTWFATQGNTMYEVPMVVAPYKTWANEQLLGLPNELLILVPPDRLRTLPLSRLTLFTNDLVLSLVPEAMPLLTNERVLSFSNDVLLKYLPDARLKTFSMERIRTFPADVQTRLGFPPPDAPAASPMTAPLPVNGPTDPGGGTAP